MESTGVTATASIDEIVELGADCVLYMPNALNLDELCRLLAAGMPLIQFRGHVVLHDGSGSRMGSPRDGMARGGRR